MKLLARLAFLLVATLVACSAAPGDGEPQGSSNDRLTTVRQPAVEVVCGPCGSDFAQTCTEYFYGRPCGSYMQRCFTYVAPPPAATDDEACDGGECQGCGPTGCMGSGAGSHS